MQAIGIDIGGTTIKAGLVDQDGTVLDTRVRPTVTASSEALVLTLTSLVEDLGRGYSPEAIGLGIPGLRSKDTGVIEFSPNLTCLNGVNLEGDFSKRIELPVVGRNDADMSAWGEFLVGAGIGTSDLACLTLGTGVGSGLILNGRPYTGLMGYAAEAGHIVVEPDGLPCPCGGRGCLETVASATGLVNLAREKTKSDESLTATSIHKAAREGDTTSLAVIAEAGRYLGIACATLINLLNLEMIVIGGGLSAVGELLLEPARAEAEERTYPQTFSNCRILTSKLGNNAGIIGAALFALKPS